MLRMGHQVSMGVRQGGHRAGCARGWFGAAVEAPPLPLCQGRRLGRDDDLGVGVGVFVGHGQVDPRRVAGRREGGEPRPRRRPAERIVGWPPGRLTTPEIGHGTRRARSRCRAPWRTPPWRRSAWRRCRRGWCRCAGPRSRRSVSVNTRIRNRSPNRSITRSMRRMSQMSEPRPRIIRARPLDLHLDPRCAAQAGDHVRQMAQRRAPRHPPASRRNPAAG